MITDTELQRLRTDYAEASKQLDKSKTLPDKHYYEDKMARIEAKLQREDLDPNED